MTVQITTCPSCGQQTGMYEAGRTASIAADKCVCAVVKEYHDAEAAFVAEVTANEWASRAINERRRLAKEALQSVRHP